MFFLLISLFHLMNSEITLHQQEQQESVLDMKSVDKACLNNLGFCEQALNTLMRMKYFTKSTIIQLLKQCRENDEISYKPNLRRLSGIEDCISYTTSNTTEIPGHQNTKKRDPTTNCDYDCEINIILGNYTTECADRINEKYSTDKTSWKNDLCIEYRKNNSDCIPTEETKTDICYFDQILIEYLNSLCPEETKETEEDKDNKQP